MEHIIFSQSQNEYEKRNAIAIQTSQLNRWAKVLNSDSMAKLTAFCASENVKAITAADIPRGSKLNEFINLLKDDLIF